MGWKVVGELAGVCHLLHRVGATYKKASFKAELKIMRRLNTLQTNTASDVRPAAYNLQMILIECCEMLAVVVIIATFALPALYYYTR